MRLRIRHTKLGKVRFVSHRDGARIWERTLRRARVPVAYSEGFSPRPKLSFGLALSTGYESIAEYLDVELRRDIDWGELPTLLTENLPDGMAVTAVAPVDRSAGSLQQVITSCRWEITCDGDPAPIEGAVAQALAAESIVVTRERKGREVTDDLRPQVRSLELTDADGGPLLIAELGTQPRALRPAELADALELDVRHVRRTHQLIDADGDRREPLEAAPSSAAHPRECAS